MDKVEEIVKCEHCYRYMPVSVLEQHRKDGCFIRLVKYYKDKPWAKWVYIPCLEVVPKKI